MPIASYRNMNNMLEMPFANLLLLQYEQYVEDATIAYLLLLYYGTYVDAVYLFAVIAI